MRGIVWTLVVLAGFVATTPAQVVSFEVVSVRPNPTPQRFAGVRPLPSGQFTATSVTVKELILHAWGLHESQLIGAPDWSRSEAFDIQARATAAPPEGVAGVWQMVRAMLVDRFGLRVRSDVRRLPAYTLDLARADRSLGPRMRRSTLDCAANPVPVTPNTAPLDADGWPPCGLAYVFTLTGGPGSRSRTSVKQSAVPAAEIAARLRNAAGRPVVDRTGLAGLFDLHYEYSVGGAAPAAGDPSPPDVPDLFTALREQLGLELQSVHTDVPVLIVESVQPPGAN